VNKSLKEKLEATFKDIQVSIPEDSKITITAESDSVPAILTFLKDAGFNHLALNPMSVRCTSFSG